MYLVGVDASEIEGLCKGSGNPENLPFWYHESVQSTYQSVALYARVSTKGKRQDTENQLAQLREFCA
jgi:hypothetical protein